MLVFQIFYHLLAALARLAFRSGRSTDLEIIVLRHQIQVLRRHVDRPAVDDNDRTLLAAIAAALPRRLRRGWIVTPTRCCAGTDDVLPDIGPIRHVGVRVDHRRPSGFAS